MLVSPGVANVALLCVSVLDKNCQTQSCLFTCLFVYLFVFLFVCLLFCLLVCLLVSQFEGLIIQSSMTAGLGATMPPMVPLIWLSLDAAVEVPWPPPSQGS